MPVTFFHKGVISEMVPSSLPFFEHATHSPSCIWGPKLGTHTRANILLVLGTIQSSLLHLSRCTISGQGLMSVCLSNLGVAVVREGETWINPYTQILLQFSTLEFCAFPSSLSYGSRHVDLSVRDVVLYISPDLNLIITLHHHYLGFWCTAWYHLQTPECMNACL